MSDKYGTPPGKGQKTRALYALCWASDLTPSERKVCAWLVWHANASNGRCDPGQARLSRKTGICLRSVKRATKSLAEKGLLAKRLRGMQSTSYQLNWRAFDAVVSDCEAKAKTRHVTNVSDQVVTAVTPGGDSGDTSVVTAVSPKPFEENPLKGTRVPSGQRSHSGFIAMGDSTKENRFEEDDGVGWKLLDLSYRNENAFVNMMAREVRAHGRCFATTIADELAERLESIIDGHGGVNGSVLANMAYGLLTEAGFEREEAA